MENTEQKTQETTENTTSPQNKPEVSATQPFQKKKRRKIKKICWLCKWGCLHVDYKNVDFLKRYLRNNKIVTHKITGNCLKHQHQVATAIKRARIVALLPFVEE